MDIIKILLALLFGGAIGVMSGITIICNTVFMDLYDNGEPPSKDDWRDGL